MTEIKLTKRYPHSRTEDITDAFMRGYEQGKKDGLKVGKQIVLGAFETYITAYCKTEPQPCEWCKFSDGENCFSQEPCKVMLYFKTEPQTECKMPYEDCEDCETHLKAQYGDCNKCKWYGDKQVCGRCRSRNLYAPKDEPQTEKPKIRKRNDKPFRAVWLDDDHNEIGTPQTDCSWK